MPLNPCSVRCFEYDKTMCRIALALAPVSLPGRRLSWLIEFSLSRVEDGRSSSCPSLCFLLEFIPCNHVPRPTSHHTFMSVCLFKQRFSPWALPLLTETLHTTLTQSALDVTSPLSNDWRSCLLYIGSGQLETHLGPSSADLTLQSLSSASIPTPPLSVPFLSSQH